MPTATLWTDTRNPSGHVKTTSVSKTITHNNNRLYNESGRTYEYVGDDGSANRIYRDTSVQQQ